MSQGEWRITVQKGPNRGQSYALRGGTVTLGRQEDNQIVIDDSMVSRHHARLVWQGNSYLVHDLGSANGTWVNNQRIQTPTMLRPGDALGLSQDVVLSLAPAALGLSLTQIADEYLEAGATGGRSSRTWLLMGMGGALAIVAIAAIVLALTGGIGGTSDATPEVITAVVTQAAALVMDTPQPTSPPDDTAAATPSATPQPTYTPYPTNTPYPTQPPPPTRAPAPTATTQPPQPPQPPQPTATSRPPFTIAINKVEPEPWGRPTDPGGCKGPYNDRDPVKRFTIELIVTNHTNRTMESGWLPIFYTAQEKIPQTCIWVYDNMSIQPGETAYVTFVTHVESDDWVQVMALGDENYQVFICFNAAGQTVPCQ